MRHVSEWTQRTHLLKHALISRRIFKARKHTTTRATRAIRNEPIKGTDNTSATRKRIHRVAVVPGKRAKQHIKLKAGCHIRFGETICVLKDIKASYERQWGWQDGNNMVVQMWPKYILFVSTILFYYRGSSIVWKNIHIYIYRYFNYAEVTSLGVILCATLSVPFPPTISTPH